MFLCVLLHAHTHVHTWLFDKIAAALSEARLSFMGAALEDVYGAGGGGGSKAEKTCASLDKTMAKYDNFLVHSGFGHVVTADGGETYVRGTVTQRRRGVFWCDSEMAFVELRGE